LKWIGISSSKFHDWKQRFGKVNEHNAWVPRDHWITDDERQAIETFARGNPLEGYRRLTYLMLDADIVACSPSTVYRALRRAGLLAGQAPKPTKKGTGFHQPLAPHQHWHIDISHLNIAGTFYFQCSILDGFSRFVVHGEIREKMAASDVETILQRAREKFPHASPRIITDNGPQFIARDFKEFIRIAGMTHVKTSPFYPQSNGKIERWHQTLKGESIRPRVPLSLEDARRIVSDFVEHYNTRRLNSAIGYITPADMLEGRQQQIFDERNRKLAAARQIRAQRRAEAQHNITAAPHSTSQPGRSIDFAAIHAQLRINDVLELLGFRSRSVRGAQVRGACPLHGATRGTSRCFSANTEKQVFHCFKCGCHGNALDLWAKAQRLSPYDAALDLCQRLNLTATFNSPQTGD
jgi:transposase InsO family protein